MTRPEDDARIRAVLALCDEAEQLAALAIRGRDDEGIGFDACVSSSEIRDAIESNGGAS